MYEFCFGDASDADGQNEPKKLRITFLKCSCFNSINVSTIKNVSIFVSEIVIKCQKHNTSNLNILITV